VCEYKKSSEIKTIKKEQWVTNTKFVYEEKKVW